MTIKAQTLTTANAATNVAASNALFDAVKALILSHSNWTLVEDATVGTSGYRWLAFKCTAAGSGMPTDSYVLFVLQPGLNFTAYAGESYNPATHTLSNACPGLSVFSSPVSASGQFATAPAVSPNATGSPNITGTVPPQSVTTSVAATTLYWHSFVYDDHLVFAAATTQAAVSGGMFYAGGYATLIPTPATNDPVQIVMAWHGVTNTTNGVPGVTCTREPLQGASTSRFYPCCHFPRGLGGTAQDIDYGRAGISTVTPTDAYQGGAIPVANHLLVSFSNTISGSNGNQASLRGRFNNSLVSYNAATIAGIALGDTIVYNGTQWAYMGASWFVDTGLAP